LAGEPNANAEMFVFAAAAHGQDDTLPFLAGRLAALDGWLAVVAFLDRVAALEPRLAQRGFAAWGQGRRVDGNLNLMGRSWVASLPDGLMVGGDLILDPRLKVPRLPDQLEVMGSLWLGDTDVNRLPEGLRVGLGLNLVNTQIASLPDGLEVGHYLCLWNTFIQTLPSGLRVGDDLILLECPRWDGRIPSDAKVAGLVLTDQHLEGVSLKEWRRLHPLGERA
jgi:hypothetical protein